MGTHTVTQICNKSDPFRSIRELAKREFKTMLRRLIAISASIAVMAMTAPMPAHALAPQSSFSQEEKKPADLGVQASPEERFLGFLEDMRIKLARLNKTQGMRAFGFVVKRKTGLVTIVGGGESSPKALTDIPAHALQFMAMHGLEELRFPLEGPYLPRLEQAIAQSAPSQQALLRWTPRLNRRSFLGAMGTSLRILWSRPPTLDSLVESVSAMANPVVLKYSPKPLTRGEEMARAFALDNILKRAGPAGWMAYLPESEDSLPTPESLWRSFSTEQERARIVTAAVESLVKQYGHYIEIALSLGDAQDHEWILAVRDAILISPAHSYASLRAEMLSRFNTLCPEFATPLSALEFLGGALLDSQKTPYQRWRIEPEFLDLDHLEYEAWTLIEGTAARPSFIDVIHDTYVRDIHDVHGAMGTLADSNNEIAMWNLLPLEIKRRGGITARGMAQLRRITGVYRKAMEQMAARGDTTARDNCRQIVERLDQTMREVPLKLEAEQAGRGEALSAKEYTILAGDKRTFAQVIEEYKRLDILYPVLIMPGIDIYDPRTYGTFPDEDLDFVVSLSRMTIQELAIQFRRLAEGQLANEDMRYLAVKYPESDMELLQGFVSRLAGLDVAAEDRGRSFAHLLPVPIKNRNMLKQRIEKARASGNIERVKKYQEILMKTNRSIAILREIVRRWVKPEEFDFEKNAIARVVRRDETVATISQHMEKILSSAAEPNFWLGGKESALYVALGIRAELTIQRGESVLEKARALQAEKQLRPQDIVLVCYRDPYKVDPYVRWDNYDRIRLVAAPLEKLLDPMSARWVEATQTRFAYKTLTKDKQPIPFLLEQTLAIEPAFQRHISREGVYLDRCLQGRGLGLALVEQGRRNFEEYFDGFSISTIVGNVLTAQTFHAFYDADLDDGSRGARVSYYAIDVAQQLDLIDHRVAQRLSDEAFASDRTNISRERLNYFLRQRWGGSGGNVLAAIVAHLERVSTIKGKNWVNNLLLESDVLFVMGKVRKSSPRASLDDQITKVLDAAA